MKATGKIKVAVVIALACATMSTHAGYWDTNKYTTIGYLKNSADSTGYGAVNYEYGIGKTEVTIADWGAFYNDAGSGKVGTFAADYNTYSSF